MNFSDFGEHEITGITCDSRQVRPGYLFAAIPGTRADGRTYIADAVARGAAAVLAPPDTGVAPGTLEIPVIPDENPRRQYALMAARFFADQPSTIACVTGTNGKSSVASFLRQLWALAGRPSASAGTLGIELDGFADGNAPTIAHQIALTTPDPADLHASLAELSGHGVEHLALEASSHGLSQYRLDGVRVAAAAFTNLTRDHLDYHGGMDGYLAAKRRLFSDIVIDGGAAVINADAEYAEAFDAAARNRGLRIYTYGTKGRDATLHDLRPDGAGQVLDLSLFGERHEIRLPLPARFQAMNALAAAALAVVTGLDAVRVAEHLVHLSGVRGRLEHVGRHSGGADIYVDYAHTPDALESVLAAMRPHAAGRLHVIFGCGGDRDPGKRPEMGRIAAAGADVVFVTDDNPRTEDAAEIRRQTLTGCPAAREIGDRRKAIETAISGLAAGDILIVAGKGHESGQIVGEDVLPFDDASVVNEILGRGDR